MCVIEEAQIIRLHRRNKVREAIFCAQAHLFVIEFFVARNRGQPRVHTLQGRMLLNHFMVVKASL